LYAIDTPGGPNSILRSGKGKHTWEHPDLQKLFLMNRPHYVEEFEGWMRLFQEAIVKFARR
jgi:hypothetical protein